MEMISIWRRKGVTIYHKYTSLHSYHINADITFDKRTSSIFENLKKKRDKKSWFYSLQWHSQRKPLHEICILGYKNMRTEISSDWHMKVGPRHTKAKLQNATQNGDGRHTD